MHPKKKKKLNLLYFMLFLQMRNSPKEVVGDLSDLVHFWIYICPKKVATQRRTILIQSQYKFIGMIYMDYNCQTIQILIKQVQLSIMYKIKIGIIIIIIFLE